MEISMTLDSPDQPGDLESLVDWLSSERALVGRVRMAPLVPGPGEMGALAETALVAVSSGGALTALAASLKAWLGQPHRGDIRIKIRTRDGAVIEVDAKHLDGRRLERLLQETLREQHEE